MKTTVYYSNWTDTSSLNKKYSVVAAILIVSKYQNYKDGLFIRLNKLKKDPFRK